MKKYYMILLLGLMLLLNIKPICAFAGDMQIYDEGEKLSESQYSEVYKRLHDTADALNMNIVVIIGNEVRSETVIETMTDSAYDQLYGNKADGVCLYLDLSGVPHPYDYISTCGIAQFYYTNSSKSNRIEQMHYSIDKYLYPIGMEDVTGALNEFADQLENYYEIGIPEDYYVYDDVYHKYYHVENGEIIETSRKPYHDVERLWLGGILGLLIGIMISGVLKGTVKAKYKFIHELSPTNYVNKKTVQYIQQSDTFVGERTTKTHISSNSGGRSGGSHHSSGGHSHGGHGGGGHHR